MPPPTVMHAQLLQVVLSSYEGERNAEGLCHGSGSAQLATGHTYEGEWQRGMMHGMGKLVFVDGVTYEGAFEHNSISGVGVRLGGQLRP